MSTDEPTSLRNYALLMRAPQHGWVIIPFIQALLDNSIKPGGLMYALRDAFATRDFASKFARRFFDALKPRGGSFAGAVRGQNNEADPTGEANMDAIITEFKADLSDKTKEVVDNAARLLLAVVKEMITNNKFGLRTVTEKCELVDIDGASDAYSLLDDCMSQLDPLEALLYGPGDLIALQTEGATNHGVRFRAAELRRYERRLLASFRTSTTERQLSSATLLERRSIIRTLQYMQSKAFLLDSRGQPGAPTPSAQSVVRDFYHRVLSARADAAAIEVAMQTELSGIQAGRVICDQSPRAGRAAATLALASMRASDGSQRSHAERAPAPRARGDQKRRDSPRAPRARANAVHQRPNAGRPPNAARPGAATAPRTECPNCGEFGHWGRDCPHPRRPVGASRPAGAPGHHAAARSA